MEGLGAEVSAKIRSAIKAKLIELEAYVDEELPDYIMVMVANNRNKDQMEEDLGLFLNNNTKAFTNWLHAVLEKLKKVTLEEVSKKETKKKKIKKSADKTSSKKASKEDKKVKSEKKVSKSSSSKSSSDKTKSSKNANLEQLGDRMRKKTSSHSLDDSGGKDGYNPASLLKNAVDKTKPKSSPKKSSSKKSSKKDSESSDKKKSKNMINLREEEDFYRSSKGAEADSRRRGTVTSIVSKVVKPLPSTRDREREPRERHRYRSRSFSPPPGHGYDPERVLKRSLVSRAEVPPRPSRPMGREERGGARAVSRAMVDADRSIVRHRDRDAEPEVRYRERSRDRGGRHPADPVPRLSDEDLRRYEFLQRRREEREILSREDQRQRERDLRDRHKEDQVRIKRRERRMEEDEMRIVSSRRLEEDEEDLRVIVRRDEGMDDITPESSPPKKRKLEDDDAELLEMRRKALESLMKRTDKELLKTQRSDPGVGDRKIIENSEESDSGDSDDSDTSLSEPDTGKEAEPTFIVTMDGIDDNYFKGGPKPSSKVEDKPKTKPKSLSRRKAESLADSKASSDAELELHADVSFDDIPKEKNESVKGKPKKQKVKDEVQEKPTMKVAARKRSPILPPPSTNGDSAQPVAAVKPLQPAAANAAKKAPAKSVSAAKLAASYAAKLSEIKAAKAAKVKSSSPAPDVKEITNKLTDGKADVKVAEPAVAVKTVPVKPKPAPISVTAPKAPENKPVAAVAKRKPITAPSPERSSSMTGVSKLSYPPTAAKPAGAGAVCKFWLSGSCTRGDTCIYTHPDPTPPPARSSTYAGGGGAASNASKYKWKAGHRIEY